MDLKTELLKSIWYAFTSLDVEKCGKVSKSQLKVRSRSELGTGRPLDRMETQHTAGTAINYILWLKSHQSL